MFNALDIAKYYLSKDPERKLFNNNIVFQNERNFYEGNARLNKYLFLTQVVYLARYEKLLIKDVFLAYENGPVVKKIMKEFPKLVGGNSLVELDKDTKEFLDKIYMALENASYHELIEITHEDPEWIRLKDDTYNAPTMNLKRNVLEYKERYKGLILALDL